MRRVALALALAAACTSAAPPAPPPMRVRADDTDLPPLRELQDLVDPWAGRPSAATPAEVPSTTVLVILGGARADRVERCGGRASTALLDTLVTTHGAVLACSATTPITDPARARDLLFAPALTDAARASGRRTLLVSGDPLDAPRAASFDVARVATDARAMKHPALAPQVDALLADVSADTPLLLVVVVPDALAPWAPVPRERWGRNQEWLDLHAGGVEDRRVTRLRDGTLSLDEEDRFRRLLDAAFDHSLERGDLTVRAVLAALVAHGRTPATTRLAVVGDHGTWLGESGRVGAHDVDDPISRRVPLLLVDVAGRAAPILPEAPSIDALTTWLNTGTW